MGQGLSIKKCDFKVTMNNNNHHTEEISTERLMVRRGQPFTITVCFSAPIHNYLWQLKRILLIVQTGSHPSKADGTQTEFPISSLGDQKQWSAALEEQDPCFWTISVNTPANAPIGQYTLLLHASKSDHLLGNFTLLFNPWCQDDEVFLANEAQRQEYILNQDGVIYWGTENAVLAQPWDFSQFEEDIVDICFTLLDVGERHRDKDHIQRKNPVYICRTVAAMLNSDEFRGILTECGTGQYFNGTPPSKWLGSSPILRQWVASQCKPVRYGQCWVFAAVMCSVLRCLGIPTRVVTGFTWAHNTNSSLSVDEYYDEDGTLLTQDKNARVWTFHVWNECWMARADLLPEYSGWQALDATCQEKSKGPSFCGPAPVQAIKEGDTEADYDVCYFFAAINAKRQVWIQKADDTLKPALGSTKYTGNNISTKSVGSERCEDITQNYKYPEGSLQEKVVLDKAYTKIKKLETISSSSKTQFSFVPTALEEPVNLFMHLQLRNSLLRGQDVPLSIEVFNHSGGEKATHLLVGAQSLHYNGVPITQLWKEEFHFTLRSNEANNLQVFLPYSQYKEELGQDHLLRLTAVLKDEDSFYIYFAQEEIIICDPPLTIEFPENMVQYQPSTAKIGLLNPLTEPLEKCVIVVAGRGLIYRQRKYKLGSVQPKSTQQLQIPFTPTQTGPRRLTAHLTCLQLQNLKSYKTINIATA
ncbi:protein 4.2-like isoform X2 [Pezoporus wallicus]|uniref:protein 4.2-like isoform X2 n=1 Tax=Pezoporus wallicus TaxID=35540 RepID=UPI00254FA584|nr:protein 4.2-like isoform X2 [Pezoporus wallicus]XP_061297866.1 protein 4.2-like isoform X2 [Pezoporus flaviventris]